jgi:hypothetical protein
MVNIEVGIWGEDVTPQARRNLPQKDLTVLDLHGGTTSPVRIGLYAPHATDARGIIARLRGALDEWEQLVNRIDAERVEVNHAA